MSAYQVPIILLSASYYAVLNQTDEPLREPIPQQGEAGRSRGARAQSDKDGRIWFLSGCLTTRRLKCSAGCVGGHCCVTSATHLTSLNLIFLKLPKMKIIGYTLQGLIKISK